MVCSAIPPCNKRFPSNKPEINHIQSKRCLVCPKCAVNFANVANLKTHAKTCTSAMLGEVEIVQWENPIVDVMANVGNIPVVNVEEMTPDTDNIRVTLEELTAPSPYYEYYNY